MGGTITVGPSRFEENSYSVEFHASANVKRLFREEVFHFEFVSGSCFPDVPRSIAIIPLVASLLPLSWIYDIKINVDEIDRAFYEAIPRIKLAYTEMLPKLRFGGELSLRKIVDNNWVSDGSPLVLFSGGVDAWCTLVRHIDERPQLVTVWGSDILLDSDDGWAVLDGQSKRASVESGLSYTGIKSNFRSMFSERVIDQDLLKMAPDYKWWHEFQHGIGLISLTVPVAYLERSPITYIASSFSYLDKGLYTCASDLALMINLLAVRCELFMMDMSSRGRIKSRPLFAIVPKLILV